MKFMDRVMTQSGPGLVIGNLTGGGTLVAIRREDLVGLSCRGPCLNMMMGWCGMHQVLYPAGGVCLRCQEEKDGRR